MNRTVASLVGLGVLAMVATATPAYAEEGTQPYPSCANKVVSARESDQAHDKYIAARLEYDEAVYDRAIVHFRQAYALDCTKHDLLLIISSAYQLKGDKREALAALETYVARVPNSPDLATYQVKIENLKAGIAEDAKHAPTPTKPVVAAEPRGHTPYPWIVVGVGGAAVAAGLVLALVPSVPDNCVDGKCTPRAGQVQSELVKDAMRATDLQTAGWITFGGGLALVAGGLLWHFLEPTGPRSTARTRVTPTVAPGFAGMSVGGAF